MSYLVVVTPELYKSKIDNVYIQKRTTTFVFYIISPVALWLFQFHITLSDLSYIWTHFLYIIQSLFLLFLFEVFKFIQFRMCPFFMCQPRGVGGMWCYDRNGTFIIQLE